MSDHRGKPGAKWRPANLMERTLFWEKFCFLCQSQNQDTNLYFCPILEETFGFDPAYPSEWVYGADGKPTCTAFEEE